VAPPFAEAEFDILYNQGINRESSILDVALSYGVVQKRGAWFQYDGELIGQGKESARTALCEKPELTEQIINDIMAKRNPEEDTSGEKDEDKTKKSEKDKSEKEKS
jgi:recombination protein RecA